MVSLQLMYDTTPKKEMGLLYHIHANFYNDKDTVRPPKIKAHYEKLIMFSSQQNIK